MFQVRVCRKVPMHSRQEVCGCLQVCQDLHQVQGLQVHRLQMLVGQEMHKEVRLFVELQTDG